jgi:hypothetical protein
MRDQFVHFRFQFGWNGKNSSVAVAFPHHKIQRAQNHRHVSLIMWPGIKFSGMLRLTKLGARIFSRYGVPPPLLLM